MCVYSFHLLIVRRPISLFGPSTLGSVRIPIWAIQPWICEKVGLGLVKIVSLRQNEYDELMTQITVTLTSLTVSFLCSNHLKSFPKTKSALNASQPCCHVTYGYDCFIVPFFLMLFYRTLPQK